jgi:N-acetylglutamate synthase-like GNAT family acetyltransferase
MTGSGARLLAQPLATWERDGLAMALAKAGLPVGDVRESGPQFWRFEREDVPIGFGGLEIHAEDALLRSVVTVPPLRNRGHGRAIVTMLEMEARAHGCRALYLLTTTAREFFEKLGYAPCDRDSVPKAIAASRMFSLTCPQSAAIMVKRL